MKSHLRGSMMSLLLSMEEEISSEEESEDRVKMEKLLSLSFLTALRLGGWPLDHPHDSQDSSYDSLKESFPCGNR